MRPPPRGLVAVAGVALVLGTAIAVAGAWRTGLSWDEAYHVMRMENFLQHGWYLLDADLDAAGEPGSWVPQRHVYAPVTMVLLHGWGLLWGTDGRGTVGTSATAYGLRHLVVVVIALVGVLAAALVTRVLLRSRGWAVVTAAVLVAVPTWTGHAMVNVKDVPVATGFTLVTLGVCVAARAAGRRLVTAGLVTTLAGLVLAIGTRPGIWPGVFLAGGVGVLVCLLARRWVRAVLLVAVAAAGVGALVALYPAAFGNPVSGLWVAATESAAYGEQRGRWWYLPLYLVVELPTGIALLGAAGTAVLVAGLVARLRRRVGAVSDGVDPLVAGLVLLQTFTLPALAVARESNVYTGIRQLLFAAPGLAVLATVALAWLWTVASRRSSRWSSSEPRRASSRPPQPTRPAAAAAAVVVVGTLAIAVPLVVQLQLFPYSYAFSSIPANLVSPRLAAQDRDLEVQTDYWRTSVRELAPAVPVDGRVVCTPRIDEAGRFLPRADESRADCASDPIGPLRPWVAERAGTEEVGPTTFLAVDAGSAYVGTNCTALDRVTRRLWWRTVTMSSVSDCDLVLPGYPVDGVRFDGAGSGADLLSGPWSLLRKDPGAGLPAGATGLVSVRLPAAWAGLSLQVSGHILDGTDLTATANGQPTPVSATEPEPDAGTETGTAWRLHVPAATAAAYGGGRLVVQLGNPGPATARLLDLAITPLPATTPATTLTTGGSS